MRQSARIACSVVWLVSIFAILALMAKLWLDITKRDISAIHQCTYAAIGACHLIAVYAGARALTFIIRDGALLIECMNKPAATPPKVWVNPEEFENNVPIGRKSKA